MKTKIFFVVAPLFLFSMRFTRAQEPSPVFQIGQPAWRSFSTTASGYGALAEDQTHVSVYVPLKESGTVRRGAGAQVRLGAPEEAPVYVTGRVTSVLPDADPRTGQSIISIQIPWQQVPPRTYVSATIQTGSRRALAVPSTAVLIIGGEAFVFRRNEKNDFEKTPVRIGEQNPDFTEIAGGIRETDHVLVEGALEWVFKDMNGSDEP